MLTAKTIKRLQTTQAQLQEISYAQAQLQETSIQTKLQKKYVWGWTLDIQSVVFTIQIRYRLLRL